MSGLPDPGATEAQPASDHDPDVVEPKPRFGLWIALNVASVVLCGALPTGIAGFVIALLSQDDWAGGDRVGARRKYKLAVLLGSISLVWAGLVVVVVVVAILLSTLPQFAREPPPVY